MIRRAGPLLTLATLACAGCAVTGDPVAAPETTAPSSTPPSTIRQTDDTGKRLPFDTAFPDRWSSNNDGTKYEPCTAVSDQTLTRLGLNPASASDTAAANHQTVRGCRWKFIVDSANSLAQSVGNGPTLAEYRSKNDGIFVFLPTITISGREIMRFRIPDTSECTATVRSGGALVHTTVLTFGNTPPPDELCEIPVNFLRATIDKIPR